MQVARSMLIWAPRRPRRSLSYPSLGLCVSLARASHACNCFAHGPFGPSCRCLDLSPDARHAPRAAPPALLERCDARPRSLPRRAGSRRLRDRSSDVRRTGRQRSSLPRHRSLARGRRRAVRGTGSLLVSTGGRQCPRLACRGSCGHARPLPGLQRRGRVRRMVQLRLGADGPAERRRVLSRSRRSRPRVGIATSGDQAIVVGIGAPSRCDRNTDCVRSACRTASLTCTVLRAFLRCYRPSRFRSRPSRRRPTASSARRSSWRY